MYVFSKKIVKILYNNEDHAPPMTVRWNTFILLSKAKNPFKDLLNGVFVRAYRE